MSSYPTSANLYVIPVMTRYLRVAGTLKPEEFSGKPEDEPSSLVDTHRFEFGALPSDCVARAGGQTTQGPIVGGRPEPPKVVAVTGPRLEFLRARLSDYLKDLTDPRSRVDGPLSGPAHRQQPCSPRRRRR